MLQRRARFVDAGYFASPLTASSRLVRAAARSPAFRLRHAEVHDRSTCASGALFTGLGQHRHRVGVLAACIKHPAVGIEERRVRRLRNWPGQHSPPGPGSARPCDTRASSVARLFAAISLLGPAASIASYSAIASSGRSCCSGGVGQVDHQRRGALGRSNIALVGTQRSQHRCCLARAPRTACPRSACQSVGASDAAAAKLSAASVDFCCPCCTRPAR